MVNQGDIIKINFNPQSGHEQAGNRPAVVVSNSVFNMKTRMAIVCPITNTDNGFPLHIPLVNMETTGFVLCEHIRSLDVDSRGYVKIESMPKNLLKKVLDVVFAEIETNP
jgi:mRNA interferase MazF